MNILVLFYFTIIPVKCCPLEFRRLGHKAIGSVRCYMGHIEILKIQGFIKQIFFGCS